MFSMLIKLMEESSRRWNSAATSSSHCTKHKEMKLMHLTEKDDIEANLTTFEQMMEVYDIGKEKWAYKLPPQLTGKAQQAYAGMQPEKAGDYKELKSAVLRRYDINEEMYYQRFKTSKRQEGESFRELAVCLMDLSKKWTKDCNTIEDIREAVVVEQFINILPDNMRIWIKERKPTTSLEAGKLANDYLQARGTSRDSVIKSQAKGPLSKTPVSVSSRKRCLIVIAWIIL